MIRSNDTTLETAPSPGPVSTPPCFAAGTRILTADGEVAVEDLRKGDLIALEGGATAPLIWLGHRRIDTSRHPHPGLVYPILIEAGAIATGMPRRDLLVSPNHAIFLEGRLIPATTLINGATVRQLELNAVTYFHIELPEPAILHAEGTPASSYGRPDYGRPDHRGAFTNGGTALTLHPEFAQAPSQAAACARIASSGPVVERIRRRLLARAAIVTTSDPGLAIRHRSDGSAIIESRSAIPGHITQDPRDRRTLGVKIATLTIANTTVPLNHRDLREGWHPPDADGRWTNGHAIIPASLIDGDRSIEVTLAASLAYPIGERRDAARSIG